jgi:hypothetical protein
VHILPPPNNKKIPPVDIGGGTSDAPSSGVTIPFFKILLMRTSDNGNVPEITTITNMNIAFKESIQKPDGFNNNESNLNPETLETLNGRVKKIITDTFTDSVQQKNSKIEFIDTILTARKVLTSAKQINRKSFVDLSLNDLSQVPDWINHLSRIESENSLLLSLCPGQQKTTALEGDNFVLREKLNQESTEVDDIKSIKQDSCIPIHHGEHTKFLLGIVQVSQAHTTDRVHSEVQLPELNSNSFTPSSPQSNISKNIFDVVHSQQLWRTNNISTVQKSDLIQQTTNLYTPSKGKITESVLIGTFNEKAWPDERYKESDNQSTTGQERIKVNLTSEIDQNKFKASQTQTEGSNKNIDILSTPNQTSRIRNLELQDSDIFQNNAYEENESLSFKANNNFSNGVISPSQAEYSQSITETTLLRSKPTENIFNKQNIITVDSVQYKTNNNSVAEAALNIHFDHTQESPIQVQLSKHQNIQTQIENIAKHIYSKLFDLEHNPIQNIEVNEQRARFTDITLHENQLIDVNSYSPTHHQYEVINKHGDKLPISTKDVSSVLEVWHALEHQISMLSKNIQTATIKIRLPELGSLTVEINMNGQSIETIFLAHDPAAQKAIELDIPRLQKQLNLAGIELKNIDVRESIARLPDINQKDTTFTKPLTVQQILQNDQKDQQSSLIETIHAKIKRTTGKRDREFDE